MKKILLVVALCGVFGLAQAKPDNTGCQGNCPGGDTVNNITNAGGAGGAGGHGGTGIGVGVGIGQGGSVKGSGNSHNANTNKNTNANANLNNNRNSNKNSNSNLNAQGQLQGQQQGQAQQATAKQGQSQSSRNDNRSNATNSNSNANSGNNSHTSVSVQGDSYEAARIPVSTAYAPNIMPTAVCMGSSSGGFSGASVSVSLGSSWTDSNCMLLEQVRTVAAVIGDRETAQEMMCDVAAYAKARSRSGKPCAGDVKPALTVVSAQRPASTQEKAVQYTGNDPIIRKRLGLPPLK